MAKVFQVVAFTSDAERKRRSRKNNLESFYVSMFILGLVSVGAGVLGYGMFLCLK